MQQGACIKLEAISFHNLFFWSAEVSCSVYLGRQTCAFVSYLSLPPHTCFVLHALLCYVTCAHVCGFRQKKKCKCLLSNTTHEDVEARPFTHEYTVNCPVNLHWHLFFLSCTQMLISYTYLLRSACVRRCVCVCVCVRARGTNHPISSLDRLEGGMHEGFVKIEDKSHLVLHLN
jgi:hypothetical protein